MSFSIEIRADLTGATLEPGERVIFSRGAVNPKDDSIHHISNMVAEAAQRKTGSDVNYIFFEKSGQRLFFSRRSSFTLHDGRAVSRLKLSTEISNTTRIDALAELTTPLLFSNDVFTYFANQYLSLGQTSNSEKVPLSKFDLLTDAHTSEYGLYEHPLFRIIWSKSRHHIISDISSVIKSHKDAKVHYVETDGNHSDYDVGKEFSFENVKPLNKQSHGFSGRSTSTRNTNKAARSSRVEKEEAQLLNTSEGGAQTKSLAQNIESSSLEEISRILVRLSDSYEKLSNAGYFGDSGIMKRRDKNIEELNLLESRISQLINKL